MSNKDPQSSALLILSPLTSRLLDTQAAINAAVLLKQHGVGRADITMDPRISFDNSHGHTYPLPSFESAARRISESILRPMIGQSDVVDFSRASADENRLPTLSTLSTVGSLFTRAADKSHAALSGRTLGFVFYVALHAQTPERKFYTHLVYPELSRAQRTLLSEQLRTSAQGQSLDAYGGLINLNETRARMMDRGSTQAAISPKRVLN